MFVAKFRLLLSDVRLILDILKKYSTTFQGHRERVVIINSIRSYRDIFNLELGLALLHISRGYSVEIILDNGVFRHVDTLQYGRNMPLLYYKLLFALTRLKRRYGVLFWKQIFKRHENLLRIVKVSDIVKVQDIQDSLVYDNHYFAEESIVRFLQNDNIASNSLNDWYRSQSAQNVEVSLRIGEYVRNKMAASKEITFLTSHGIYSLWGPAFKIVPEHFKKVVYGPNFYRARSLSFYTTAHQVTSNDNILQDFLKSDLSEEQEEIVLEYLENRFSFKEKDTSVYFSSEEHRIDLAFTKDELPGKVYIAFPNVIWDGNIKERNILFGCTSDWVRFLISEFSENSNNSLIIRFHPAETTWFNGTLTFEEALETELKAARNCPNIKIISSSESCNSYELLRNYADYALIYDGILALEAPFLGVPVIFGAQGRFNVGGYGIQFSNVNEFSDFLKSSEAVLVSPEELEIARKLIYFYMFVNNIYFPILANDSSDFGIDLNEFLDAEKFYKCADEVLSYIKKC